MPELPEVETMRRGIEPHILKRTIVEVEYRRARLRYPLPLELKKLRGAKIEQVERRAKYLLIITNRGQILIHLGMSGVLHILQSDYIPRKHDHVIIRLEGGLALFYNDPRRFGFIKFYPLAVEPKEFHHLAPEPLSEGFNSDYLYRVLSSRRRAIKGALMDQALVVGVGNIYANEALFSVGIHPERTAMSLTQKEVSKLVAAIKKILRQAIEQGGTTLKDFTNPEGQPGYFAQKLSVYGREGEPCYHCKGAIVRTLIAQRATFFCPQCQPAS